MKVLDLQCQLGHVFEGWFGSEQEYQSQLTRGLVECPVCGSKNLTKRVTAARLNLSGAKEVTLPQRPSGPGAMSGKAVTASQSVAGPDSHSPDSSQGVGGIAAQVPPELQAAWLKLARHVIENTTDVGSNFAEEARRIHEGSAPERAIRGQATREEAMELLEDGIGILPLPLPEHLKGTLQ